MAAERKFTEVDTVCLSSAEDIEIDLADEHVLSIRLTSHGKSREVQVMSYGEPLSIYVETP